MGVFLTDEQHVARLALVGRLMASTAHEVKQPLTAIAGNAAAALEALGSSTAHPHADELREILRDIAAESRLAAELIDRLHALSRKRPLQFVPVDLNDIAAETMRLLASEARGRHIALCGELEPSLPAVRADRGCMQHVVLSIALNAMDAMEVVDAAPRGLALRTRRLGDGAELSISDTGSGISDAALPSFCEASHARSLVEAHRGRIWADNTAAGATFHVALPTIA